MATDKTKRLVNEYCDEQERKYWQKLIADGNRIAMLQALANNDSNGIYLDEDCMLEFDQKLTLQEAIDLCQLQIDMI